mmetsp:Transcript_29333/g.50619  ORF Transcript_29333/g.50619 Transcript_29333/m.50619 type:complete len:167 (-) Transcript_29333:274-774(-)
MHLFKRMLTWAAVISCLLFTVDARTPVPLPGPLRPLGWLFGGIAIDEFFAAQFESGPLKKLVCDHERSENNKRLKRCKLKLREARAEVRRATEHLEMARNTRDVYLKELLERARTISMKPRGSSPTRWGTGQRPRSICTMRVSLIATFAARKARSASTWRFDGHCH